MPGSSPLRRRSAAPANGCRRPCTPRCSPARRRASPSARTSTPSTRSSSPRAPPACRQRELGTTVLGQPISLPVVISPTGVQAVHPDGELAVARAAAARGTAMGLSSFASKPIERGGHGQPEDLPPAVLDRRPRRHDPSGRTGPGRRRGRTDPHPRLVVLAQPRLGQPAHPGAPQPPGAAPPRPARAAPPPLAAAVRRAPAACPTSPCPTWPTRAARRRRSSARTAQWMQTPPPTLGGRRLAARAVGRTVPAQGRHPGRRGQARRGRRRQRHLGVQPRREQPRRHARRPSARCRPSPTRSATRSRSCSTAASAGAATSSRRSRSARGRC